MEFRFAAVFVKIALHSFYKIGRQRLKFVSQTGLCCIKNYYANRRKQIRQKREDDVWERRE